jgi:glutamyl-tRNA synthetase
VSVEWSSISDFVILRSNAAPVFYLANAVDDVDMRITHVVRGEDLIDSTHRVLAIRAAMGAGPQPVYAHLPLILGPDRAKLSKRHGAVSLDEFRAVGFLPEALRNYLALLAWAPADGREILALDDLVAAFDLDRVTHTNAVFDHAKLEWVNQQWIKGLPIADLEARVTPTARERFGDRLDVPVLRGALRIGQERATTLAALLDQAATLFVEEDDFAIEPASWERLVATDRIADVLDAAAAHLEACEWGAEAIDLRGPIDALGIKPRSVMPALYAAVEGRSAGLPLFDYIELLGRDRALARLRRARGALPA